MQSGAPQWPARSPPNGLQEAPLTANIKGQAARPNKAVGVGRLLRASDAFLTTLSCIRHYFEDSSRAHPTHTEPLSVCRGLFSNRKRVKRAFRLGSGTASIWPPCDFLAASLSAHCDFLVTCLWLPCGFFVTYLRLPCGFLVASLCPRCRLRVSLYLPCGFHLTSL